MDERATLGSDDALALMPRSVRDKLDRVGLKMHLAEWQACSRAERQQLCDLPCDTDDEIALRRAGRRLVIRASRRNGCGTKTEWVTTAMRVSSQLPAVSI
jgi:hypothetical protein